MGQDSNGWNTPWKITGDLKITQVYICIYKEKGKPSSKPPFLGATLSFYCVETPEAESYLLYLYIYIPRHLKQPEKSIPI